MKIKRWMFYVVVLSVCLVTSASGAKKAVSEPEEDDSLLKAETFAGLEIRNIGPALMSGRIADIAVHPDDASVWYVAVGSGNLWKTVNAGTTWETIFDDQGSYSLGDVTLDPSSPDIVWVGTGENVGGRHVGYGDGVYKSVDGGQTWKNMGLKDSEHIGRILVDPRDSNVVWVAAQGPLWSKGGERGLYKTTDGGETWENVLSDGPYTGVNEMIMDPRNPDVLYATTHQRYRTVAALIDGGPETAIYKTADGGATWTKLETGLPEEDMGRIGLAISPQNPDVVYATIELAWRKGGFYRSEDGGASWEKRSDYLSGGTGPHYYQEIYASPHAFDRIYQMDVRLHWSEDGGKTFTMVGEQDKHGDNHAISFIADDPNYLLVGSDGGLYESWDLGKTWKFISNLPITQYYKVAVDYDEPFYNLYGGTQDNNTQGGPSRTVNTNGIRNSDWFITLGGDGHQPAVDYSNPDIVYSESQQGYLARYDRRTGEVVYIQPQPEKGAPAERFNWDSPILISPHDPARLYFASQRVWRSDDRGDSWTAISKDLSRGRDRLTMPMMDRVQSVDAIWDLWAMSMYANVTSLSESPVQEGLLYAGTDDGLIHMTDDNGANWRRTDGFASVPAESFVNDVKADLFDTDTVYAAFSNDKTGDFKPYLVKSTDRGQTWTSIAGDLPDRHLVWRIVQDHERPELLFVGTEFGIFFTVDGGQKWVKLTGGVPNIPFRDLVIQKRENDLVGASFGRSFFIFDDYTPLRQVSEEMLAQEATLFPVRDAWWYIEKRPMGRGAKATQGADFYVAPNPPFGAVFTYYLKDGYKTRKAERQEAEKKLVEEGGDTPNPGWEVLQEEAQQEAPAILFTISDASGNVVRRLTSPAGKGFHRVAWDLRFPETDAVTSLEEEQDFGRGGGGPLVEPGQFTVSMAKRIDGEEVSLGEPQSFEVKRMFEGTLPGASPEEMVAFSREIAEVNRQADAVRYILDSTGEQLQFIKKALSQSAHADTSLDTQVRALERRLLDLREMAYGNEQQDELGEPVPHSVGRRLSSAYMGTVLSTYGPTPNHQQTLAIAKEELAEVKVGLTQLVDVDLPAFEDKLDAAGVPWTPGRDVPD
jgi:photosystem II stability/assembly factor-like uncharacterized protein